MASVQHEDIKLTCVDCQVDFVFTAGEQEFFELKGFTNIPKRCTGCRAAKRTERETATKREPGDRSYHKAVCGQCGGEATVPFKPVQGRLVLCHRCFHPQPCE